MPHLTIDLFPYLRHIQRFLNRLFIIEFFFIILTIITFLLVNNLVSDMDYQQTSCLIT